MDTIRDKREFMISALADSAEAIFGAGTQKPAIPVPQPDVVIDKKKEKIKMLQQALNASYNCKLVIDGVKGTNTNRELDRHPVKNYSRNALAKWVQEQLIIAGYSCGARGADGEYGGESEKATRRFQANNDLTIDGIAGNKTITELLG